MAYTDECYGCQRRFLGCHGKNKDGSWRCETWGRSQEGVEDTAKKKLLKIDFNNYKCDALSAATRRRKAHHK